MDAVVVLVILGVLVLAGVAALVTARRGGSTGALSRETIQRDTSARADEPAETAAGTSLAARERADEARAMGGVPATRSGTAVVEWEPIDEDELGVTRRQFFNRSILAAVGLGVATLGIGIIGFLWPPAGGGFGGSVGTGRRLADILADIADTREPAYFAEARAYVNPYPPAAAEQAADAGYPDAVVPNLEEGFIVLYQKCPHLGCRVPWCESSQWFECPCHGSKYNRVGEKRDGPAPTGMYLFRGEVGGDGSLSIDTSVEFPGLPIGTNTTEQSAEGPSCI